MSRFEALWYPSSDSRGPARLAASPLAAAEGLFRLGVSARNAMYDAGWIGAAAVEGARVVSVGNLTVGGAGKTPAVLWMAERCIAAGVPVAIVSRGYGRQDSEDRQVPADGDAARFGDEPLLLKRRCPAASVWAGPDRARLALRARQESGAAVILLDDGFQHRRVKRDCDVVVIDEAAGLGNGRLLPRGPLREPPSALRRAHLLWIRTDESASPPSALPLPPLPRVRALYAPSDVVGPDGEPAALAGVRCLALAAIARPERFGRTLRGLGAAVEARCEFPDHHAFTPADLDGVRARAKRDGLRIVTTEKDAVRLPKGFPAWTVRLGVRILEGEAHALAALGL